MSKVLEFNTDDCLPVDELLDFLKEEDIDQMVVLYKRKRDTVWGIELSKGVSESDFSHVSLCVLSMALNDIDEMYGDEEEE